MLLEATSIRILHTFFILLQFLRQVQLELSFKTLEFSAIFKQRTSSPRSIQPAEKVAVIFTSAGICLHRLQGRNFVRVSWLAQFSLA